MASIEHCKNWYLWSTIGANVSLIDFNLQEQQNRKCHWNLRSTSIGDILCWCPWVLGRVSKSFLWSASSFFIGPEDRGDRKLWGYENVRSLGVDPRTNDQIPGAHWQANLLPFHATGNHCRLRGKSAYSGQPYFASFRHWLAIPGWRASTT